uniref:ATP synthase F0 subunit 8 n=1 Tax=Drabescus ineffectus TaxID=2754845 RepID=A0A7G3XWE2_9HEMI|nr:ATP synthase F0 subunit 8 [Drabescus ineffectus]QLJ57896.1 ATP synthase F0 subunit 8 [Drabescus ineffectus]
MPQMAPMWWTFMMMMTVIMLMITMTINYFNTNKKINMKYQFKSIKMPWAW